mmetsp:Transcript_8489/g.20463  ORF Transcript_8489/g.20463 Transcript_8489/m.20463 type:complete len:216 (-) Transcript_8489:129-776(-)
MRHPPDMSFVARAIMDFVKPSPCNSSAALESNVWGSILSNFSPIWSSKSAFFSASSSIKVSVSASNRFTSSLAFCVTDVSASASEGGASQSRNHMSMMSGTGTSFAAMAARIVLFPLPFCPMSPYFLPKFNSRVVSATSCLPKVVTENSEIFKSLESGLLARLPVMTAWDSTADVNSPRVSPSATAFCFFSSSAFARRSFAFFERVFSLSFFGIF